MLFCRPRSRHPLGWRLGNCRHSAGGRPKDREHPGAARSRRLARRRAHPFSADSQVFKIEVLMNGRKHFVEKRYSEFHALHKKKLLRVCGLWPLPSPKPAVWSVTAGSVSIITSAVSASTLSDDDTSASPLRFHWLYLHTPG
uniref:sorting nexin-24 isoform X3 n=1 Tax=Panthera onca TaxID=9690 RepID=UPI0029558D28|nr:sorting nexin-24 isoform X3 [Panthera onca]